jgi:hypothetical protein
MDICRNLFRVAWNVRGVSGEERYITCRPIGKFLCSLWQHCRRPRSFTCETCSFDSGRTGFVWVRRVWNGSADPTSRQMRGAFHHKISQRKSERPAEIHKLLLFMVTLWIGKMWRSGAVNSPKEELMWWWGARRSLDVVQRAGGRLLWLGDTEAGSKT